MSAVLVPPPERDLPGPARERLRARVVTAVDVAAPRRRWMPLAAAAALLAVVGGSALAVSGRQPAPVPVPAGPVTSAAPPPPTRARQLPPERDIARRCVLDAGPRGSTGALPRAVFTDERGYVAWVAGGTYSATCAYRWDGSRDSAVLGSGGLGADGRPSTGFAADGGVRVTSGLFIGLIGSRPPVAQLIFVGQVARDVARVEVRWGNRPPVRATVRGPYYLARVLSPPEQGRRPELRGSVTAYDRNGRTSGPLDFIE